MVFIRYETIAKLVVVIGYLVCSVVMQATVVDFTTVTSLTSPWLMYRDNKALRLPKIGHEQLHSLWVAYKERLYNSVFNSNEAWLEGRIPPSLVSILFPPRKMSLFTDNFSIDQDRQVSHVQRVDVSPGSKICFIGDVHGSMCSLAKNLSELVNNHFLGDDWVLPESHYICFLGDLVDRGEFSVETWCLVMHLFTMNPGQVFLVRGNHEEYESWSGQRDVPHCMSAEIEAKFPVSYKQVKKWFSKFCQTLPDALILTSGEMQKIQDAALIPARVLCCHGGIEPSVVLNMLFDADESVRYMRIEQFYHGFNWSDFTGVSNKSKGWTFNRERGCGYLADIDQTKKYLALSGMAGVFRGHQDQQYSFKLIQKGSRGVVPWFELISDNKAKKRRILPHKYIQEYGLHMSPFIGTDQTVPVFTLSTAKEARDMWDEGFVIVKTAALFSNWMLYPHIYL